MNLLLHNLINNHEVTRNTARKTVFVLYSLALFSTHHSESGSDITDSEQHFNGC